MLIAADAPNSMELDQGHGFSIAMGGDDGDRLRGYWDNLLDGRQMTVPLEQVPWGSMFGI